MSTARLYALCSLADAWHDGYWSRVYRIGTRARRLLARRGITHPLDQIDRRAGWSKEFRDHYMRERDRLADAFIGLDRI